MITSDIFYTNNPSISVILERCSEFIAESNGHPIFKNIPSVAPIGIQKIKVRKKRATELISESFGFAFGRNIRQRAVFTSGQQLTEQHSCFIFPIDGYKYLYSSIVDDSMMEYSNLYNTLLERYSPKLATNMLTDLLQMTYNTKLLSEGISMGTEIILHNIPFYYAVRTSSVPSYETLIQ